VAEELHFGRAALRLHIGQPPLSQQLRRLELDLGVQLFRRTKRKVELTAAGAAFLDGANAVLAQAARARSAAIRAANGEIGELVIGFVPTCDGRLLSRVIARLRDVAPQLRVRIESLSTSAQATALITGALDAGFVRLPLADPLLMVEPVQREGLWVSMPDQHRLAAKAVLVLDDLAGENLVLFPRMIAPGYYDALLDLMARRRLRLPVSQHAEQVQAILTIVSAGLGLSVHPEATTVLAYPGITYRRLDEAFTADTGLAWRRDRSADGLTQLLNVVRSVTQETS
jgi:DNA-binding transcriptional LysR family regulator